MQGNEVALRPQQPVQPYEEEDRRPLSAREIKAQVQLIQEVMDAVMQEGFHYGVIPGTEKPTLLKPGAEKLNVTFRLAPLLHVETREMGPTHREYEVRCTLVHIPTGRVFGEGIGSCSTMESKYRYRNQARVCPNCGRDSIQKGRAEYGGGWLCWQKKGGCGAKFADQDSQITSQPVGRIENPDIADIYNTVLKMAKKRALVDATLTVTAASDIFTQDLEDYQPSDTEEKPQKVSKEEKLGPGVIIPSPSQPAGEVKVITKAQLDILLLSQRRSKVSDAAFKDYLAHTMKVMDPKELPQRHMNAVLEWLSEQEAKREETEHRQATASSGEAMRLINKPEYARLVEISREAKVLWSQLESYVSSAYNTEVMKLSTSQYEQVIAALTEGEVAKWRSPEPATLAPHTLYGGQIKRAIAKFRGNPGELTITTDFGELKCLFDETPEALKAQKDWRELVGQRCEIAYYEDDDKGQIRKFVESFGFEEDDVP